LGRSYAEAKLDSFGGLRPYGHGIRGSIHGLLLKQGDSIWEAEREGVERGDDLLGSGNGLLFLRLKLRRRKETQKFPYNKYLASTKPTTCRVLHPSCLLRGFQFLFFKQKVHRFCFFGLWPQQKKAEENTLAS
jgi:hypothetical protein